MAGEVLGTVNSVFIPGGAALRAAKAVKMAKDATKVSKFAANLFSAADKLKKAGKLKEAAKLTERAQKYGRVAANWARAAKALEQGQRAASIFEMVQTGLGVANLAAKLFGLDCRPTSWTDFLVLVPAGSLARRTANWLKQSKVFKVARSIKPPADPSLKIERAARRLGFKSVDEFYRAQSQNVLKQGEALLAKIRPGIVNKMSQQIDDALQSGRITQTEAARLRPEVEKFRHHLDLDPNDYNVARSIEKIIDERSKAFDLLAPGSNLSLPKMNFGTGGGGSTNPFGFSMP
jgi:hypothetical protein